MKTTGIRHTAFLLTHAGISAALKTGRRRHLCLNCKGLELSVFRRKFDKPQFYYYWKERDGARSADRRVWLGEYDQGAADCLTTVYKQWEQANALREAGQPVVLEHPESPASPRGAQRARRSLGTVVAAIVPHYCAYLDHCVTLETLSLKTVKPWQYIIRRFGDAMAGMPLVAIDVPRLEAYLEKVAEGVKSKRADGRSARQNTRACLVHFFNWATLQGLVRTNPAKETSRAKYRVSHVKTADEDVSRYLVALRKMRDSGDRLSVSNYLWLMVLTGCRRDELSTATIGDFYLGERKRVIVAAKAKDRKTHYTGLSHQAVKAVKSQIALLEAKNLPTDRGALLFPAAAALKRLQRWHGDGLKPMSHHVIYKHHAKVIADAGIERFTIHDLRRIFATMAAQVGIGPDYQRLLISHTTGRREAHGVYNLHNYIHELKEGASRLAVVFDFLSGEVKEHGRREPLECQEDFTESYHYWDSLPGRRFYNESPMLFFVAGLLPASLSALRQQAVDSGLEAGIELAEYEERVANRAPRSKVRKVGNALAAVQSRAAAEDKSATPPQLAVTRADAEL